MNLSDLVVHHEISDEAAAHLSELLNDLAFVFDEHYFAQVRRYRASLRHASGTYYDERRESERSCHDGQLELFDVDDVTF